jgi:hypothetical protein
MWLDAGDQHLNLSRRGSYGPSSVPLNGASQQDWIDFLYNFTKNLQFLISLNGESSSGHKKRVKFGDSSNLISLTRPSLRPGIIKGCAQDFSHGAIRIPL